MANDKDFKIKNGLQVGGAYIEKVGTVTGNADVDLSTGNVFDYTPTANATFTFSNAGATEHSFVLSVVGDEVAAGYDLANAAYDSVSFSVAAQDVNPFALAFSNDGTKMFIVGDSNNNVYQYSLSTAFDLSTASYDSVSFSTASQDTIPQGLAFNNDGTKMYFIGLSNSDVFQYSLSTAFDLSTASYDNVSLALSSPVLNPRGLTFNNAGTKMYIVATTFDSVYQYSLSTAFDLSTASYDSVSFSVASQDANPYDVTFNTDGSKMYVVGSSSNTVYQYSLSTVFDLSTASYDSISFSVASQESYTRSLAFNGSATKMYVVGNGTDTVYQYSTAGTPAPATFTYPASVKFPSGTAPAAPADGETDILEFSTTDGGTTWYGVRTGDAMA